MTSANIDALGVPSSPSAEGAVSLRLGHAAGLTVPRTVIQYRVAASLPRRSLGVTVSFVWYFLIFVLVIVFNLGWLKIKV